MMMMRMMMMMMNDDLLIITVPEFGKCGSCWASDITLFCSVWDVDFCLVKFNFSCHGLLAAR